MKLNKIFTTLFGGALLFGAAACTDEVDYTPAENVTVDGVYLSDSDSEIVDIPTDANHVTINLYRLLDTNELTVGLSGQVLNADGTPASDIFSVPTQVTFAKGETVVPIEIGVVFGNVVPEEEYTLKLQVLGDDKQNPYGLSEREYVITYAPWSEWEMVKNEGSTEATVTFSGWLEGTAVMPVWERHSLVNENRTQLMVADPQTLELSDPDFNPTEDCDWYYILSMDKSNKITVDGQECYVVTTNIVDCNYTHPQGKVYFGCAYTVVTEILGYDHNDALALMSQNNMHQSYYNPAKGLYSINTVLYIRTATGISIMNTAFEYVLLPGYKDYWMEFEYLGNFVDNMTQEQAIVQATRCPDLASFSYVCEKGSLNDAQIKQIADEIKANTDAELNFDESSNLLLTIEEDGTYTIVAVGYDEGGNAAYETSYTFDYQSVKKESEWESRGWCMYTDGFFINPWYNPTIGGQTWDVEVQEHKNRPGYYRLVNPYQEWPIVAQMASAGVKIYDAGLYYMYVNAEDPDGVYIELFDSGVNLSAVADENVGHSMMQSGAYYHMQNGHSFEEVKANGWCGTLKNGVITFMPGSLFYAEALFQNGDPVNANLDPNNPVWTDGQKPGFQFNPFMGTGTFQIDLTTLDDASFSARKQAPAKAAKVSEIKRTANAGQFVVEGAHKANKAQGIRSSKMTDQQRKDFRMTEKYALMSVGR